MLAVQPLQLVGDHNGGAGNLQKGPPRAATAGQRRVSSLHLIIARLSVLKATRIIADWKAVFFLRQFHDADLRISLQEVRP